MKRNYTLLYIAVATAMLTTYSSCIDDDSGLGGKTIPGLTVAGDPETMKVLNFDLGTECVIRPDISYDGAESELTYTWSIGSYSGGVKGELEVVSHERDLVHFFTQGGSYYAHLNVTDGTVGSVMDWQVNINRTFEEGYVLVSADEAGNGNLAFVKTQTPEEVAAGAEPVCLEHCLAQMNDGLSETGLVGVMAATVTWPTTIHRLLVSMQDKCYFIDPNTFTVISTIDYTEVWPGFRATHFVPESIPFAYDAQSRRFVHLELEYMFGYEYSAYSVGSFDDMLACTYSSWGRPTEYTFFINRDPAEVSIFDYYSLYYPEWYPPFPTTEDLLADDELLAVFMAGSMNEDTYMTPMYIIGRSLSDRNVVRLYTSDDCYSVAPYMFTAQEYQLTAQTALPEAGVVFPSSPLYRRHFYASDNGVYVFLLENAFSLPDRSQAAIRFPEGEIVTCIDTNIETEELYVATYDKAARRGSLYIYDTADVRADNTSSPTPKAAFRHCADRISRIIYKERT